MSDILRTAVNQQTGGGTNYPFVSPVSGLDGVILDFYLSYVDGSCQYVLPFSLTCDGINITVTDANSVVVIQVPQAGGQTRAWGTRTIREWISAPNVLRTVDVGTGNGTAVLDPRTCNRQTLRVNSLTVEGETLTEAIELAGGYNIALNRVTVPGREGGRAKTRIVVDSAPGLGMGKAPGCDDVTPLLRKINNTQPDCSGNFVIEADDCFRLQLPLFMTGDADAPRVGVYSADGMSSEDAAAAWRLTSDCRPCCDCDYFVRTYRGTKRMWNKWGDVAAQAEEIRDLYEENRTRWMNDRDCRIAHSTRLAVSNIGNCKVNLGASYCNMSKCCLVDLEIRFTIQMAEWGSIDPYVERAWINGTGIDGSEPYVPESVGDGKVIRFFFDKVSPNESIVARMRYVLANCQMNQSFVVTVTVHTDDPAPNEITNEECTIPLTDDVPQSVRDLWEFLGLPEGAGISRVRGAVTKAAPFTSGQGIRCG